MDVKASCRALPIAALATAGTGRRTTEGAGDGRDEAPDRDGPLEVTKEGRGIVMRVPLEGGGRLVVEMSADEASDLGDALKAASGWTRFRDGTDPAGPVPSAVELRPGAVDVDGAGRRPSPTPNSRSARSRPAAPIAAARAGSATRSLTAVARPARTPSAALAS